MQISNNYANYQLNKSSVHSKCKNNSLTNKQIKFTAKTNIFSNIKSNLAEFICALLSLPLKALKQALERPEVNQEEEMKMMQEALTKGLANIFQKKKK